MKYKKYIVFGYNEYYPQGGLNDIVDSFDDIEDVKKFIQYAPAPHEYEAMDIITVVDRDTWEIVVLPWRKR